MEGTLLYTIDKYRNQLIISLYEEVEEKVKIEFRKEEHYLSFLELCGCNQCKYRWISLTISIDEFINIQCNHWKYFQLKYGKDNQINYAYPIIDFKNSNRSAIWLVNTPSHGDYYSNNDQLSGCINEISYNNKQLNMTISGSGVEIGCPSLCENGVCNSGTCRETFSISPLCDCTNSSRNGPYCNSSGKSFENASVQSLNEVYKFKIIKLTWQGESKEIFYLSNEKLSISIYCDNKSIIFTYNSALERVTIRKEISIGMSENKLIFITFRNKEVFIEGGQINSESIFVTADLSDIYFSSMILLNGTGIIDIVYKLHQLDYQWNQINLDKFKIISINRSIHPTVMKSEENMKILCLIVGIVLLITNIISFIIGAYCSKHKRCAKPDNTESRLPLISKTTEIISMENI